MRKRKWNNYTSGEELFGLAITQYPELEKTEKEIQMLEKLYGLYVNVVNTINGYADILWVDVTLSIDAMTETVTGFSNQCKKLPKSLRDWQAYRDCKKKIDDFVELLPLITSLSSKAMRPRHWQQLQAITGKTFDLREDVFKLGNLLEADLLGKAEDVEDLCNGALKEEQIEQRLAQTADDWSELVFSFGQYKARGTVILEGGSTSEIVEKLEDSQMQLGSMATNRYSAPFKEEVTSWIIKLSTVGEVIEMWLVVQNMWMYMEAVFSGGDIVKQLPQEAKRFQNIDKNYMKIVTSALETRNVVQTCYGNELMKNLLPHLTARAPAPALCLYTARHHLCCFMLASTATPEPALTPLRPCLPCNSTGATGAVPEVPHGLPGHEARRIPALLLRVRPDAAGDPVARVRPAGGAAPLPVRPVRLADQRDVRQERQDQDARDVLPAVGVRQVRQDGPGRQEPGRQPRIRPGQHRSLAAEPRQRDAGAHILPIRRRPPTFPPPCAFPSFHSHSRARSTESTFLTHPTPLSSPTPARPPSRASSRRPTTTSRRRSWRSSSSATRRRSPS